MNQKKPGKCPECGVRCLLACEFSPATPKKRVPLRELQQPLQRGLAEGPSVGCFFTITAMAPPIYGGPRQALCVVNDLAEVLLDCLIQCHHGRRTGFTTHRQRSHHHGVRVLTHIKKLDDAFGMFRLRITCGCGASRECAPAALARIAGPAATFAALAPRMRCSKCGTKGAAEVVAVAIPRPRGRGFRR